MHLESATAKISCSISFLFCCCWRLREINTYIYIFNAIVSCAIYVYCLMNYVFDYPTCLYLIPYSIVMPCCFAISPLGLLVWPPSCDKYLFSCMFPMCEGLLCCICATNSNSCCYTSSMLDPLATVVFVSFLVHIIFLSCWFSRRLVAFLPQPLGCIIRLEKL